MTSAGLDQKPKAPIKVANSIVAAEEVAKEAEDVVSVPVDLGGPGAGELFVSTSRAWRQQTKEACLRRLYLSGQ